MSKAKPSYGNDSISSLKGADRVRKRPGVIFGSDGLEGCEHAVFEILSNSIDEAREGYGTGSSRLSAMRTARSRSRTTAAAFRWNGTKRNSAITGSWCSASCTRAASTRTTQGENYEFSLGLNGLGTCATQYASEYMDVTIVPRRASSTRLHFEQGENMTGTERASQRADDAKKTGTTIRWKPDLEVFTDIDIPVEYYLDTLKRQAVVNSRREIRAAQSVQRRQVRDHRISATRTASWTMSSELAGEDAADAQCSSSRASAAAATARTSRNTRSRCPRRSASPIGGPRIEYYHNSSWLEHGGAPDKAVKLGLCLRHRRLPQAARASINKSESKITFQDVQDCLVLVTNCFSTMTSYENQTKKAITNKFIQEAMTEFLKQQLEIYFIENKAEADKHRRAGADQQAQPRARRKRRA